MPTYIFISTSGRERSCNLVMRTRDLTACACLSWNWREKRKREHHVCSLWHDFARDWISLLSWSSTYHLTSRFIVVMSITWLYKMYIYHRSKVCISYCWIQHVLHNFYKGRYVYLNGYFFFFLFNLVSLSFKWISWQSCYLIFW